MLFNKSRKYDFPPEMKFQDGNFLECIEETKLLGIHLSSSLSWEANTRAICKKAMGKMWLLRRLRIVKLQPELILDFYIKEVRPLLEQGVPICNSGLTRAQCRDIENVQKLCLKVILGKDYTGYAEALEELELETMKDRRESRCLKFALKSLLHPVHCAMFPVNSMILDNNKTHQPKEQFQVNWARTESYRMSSIPYIQRMLNEYVRSQQKPK